MTGYGDFKEVVDNPSWRAVSTLENELMIDGVVVKIVKRKFRVAWQDIHDFYWADDMEGGFAEVCRKHGCMPLMCLHCGIDGQSEKIKLERFAYNSAAAVYDIDNKLPKCSEIDDAREGDFRLTTMLPLTSLCEKLSETNEGVIVSDDAGRYLCNYVYYNAMWKCEQLKSRCNVLFVHVPKETHIFTIPYLTDVLKKTIILSIQ